MIERDGGDSDYVGAGRRGCVKPPTQSSFENRELHLLIFEFAKRDCSYLFEKRWQCLNLIRRH